MRYDDPAENQDYVGLLLAGAFNAMSAANWLDVGKFPNQSSDPERNGPYGYASQILAYCLGTGVISVRGARTGDEAFEAMTMVNFPCSTTDVWDNYTFHNDALLRLSSQHARSVAASAAQVAFRVVCDAYKVGSLDEIDGHVTACVDEVEAAVGRLVDSVRKA